jgi:hypothetical protein
MVTILVALGAFLLGAASTALAARYFFLMGWEMAHDDRRLEPGAVGTLPPPTPEETTGVIPAVDEDGDEVNPDGPPPDTGRHRRSRLWPSSDVDTAVVPAVEVTT